MRQKFNNYTISYETQYENNLDDLAIKSKFMLSFPENDGSESSIMFNNGKELIEWIDSNELLAQEPMDTEFFTHALFINLRKYIPMNLGL